jgi:hypothetical protein
MTNVSGATHINASTLFVETTFYVSVSPVLANVPEEE